MDNHNEEIIKPRNLTTEFYYTGSYHVDISDLVKEHASQNNKSILVTCEQLKSVFTIFFDHHNQDRQIDILQDGTPDNPRIVASVSNSAFNNVLYHKNNKANDIFLDHHFIQNGRDYDFNNLSIGKMINKAQNNSKALADLTHAILSKIVKQHYAVLLYLNPAYPINNTIYTSITSALTTFQIREFHQTHKVATTDLPQYLKNHVQQLIATHLPQYQQFITLETLLETNTDENNASVQVMIANLDISVPVCDMHIETPTKIHIIDKTAWQQAEQTVNNIIEALSILVEDQDKQLAQWDREILNHLLYHAQSEFAWVDFLSLTEYNLEN